MGEKRLPKLCVHKASGRWYVKLAGSRVYLGSTRTVSEEEAERRRLVLLAQQAQGGPVPGAGLTVADLVARHWLWAEGYYQDAEGRPTTSLGLFRLAFRPLVELYAGVPVASFGPMELRAVQARMVERGWSRKTVNVQLCRVVGLFRWGVGRALVPAPVLTALEAVESLQKGRTTAPERPKVRPVPLATVEALLRLDLTHCREDVQVAQALVRLQHLSGCRPGEARRIRGDEIDRTGDVLAEVLGERVDMGTSWVYLPGHHKTQHHGILRVIPLSQAAQDALAPWLLRAGPGLLFPSRQGRALSKATYGDWLARLCDLAHVEAFAPGRLRHLSATRLERTLGIGEARKVLGHTTEGMTKKYVAQDIEAAIRAVERLA